MSTIALQLLGNMEQLGAVAGDRAEAVTSLGSLEDVTRVLGT